LKITFFRRPVDFRRWLEKNHLTAKELHVGFHKKGSGKPSITWPESVDEALCFGWIDGIRRRIDEVSYTIRFTPRKGTSIWSAINIKRVEVLAAEKRMRPAGLQAFEKRRENKSGVYAYEQRRAQLEEPYAGLLRRNEEAFRFFEAQPPGYRKLMSWRILSAKREETRLKRLEQLIEASGRGRRL
jgi:uncharacterized protein YdeI (YjbR/CyaY-like superfamily)